MLMVISLFAVHTITFFGESRLPQDCSILQCRRLVPVNISVSMLFCVTNCFLTLLCIFSILRSKGLKVTVFSIELGFTLFNLSQLYIYSFAFDD